MSTDLAKQGTAALSVPDGYMENFPPGYDEVDHVLPWISIVQSNSGPERKAIGKEGTFISRAGDNYETLRFVLIWMQYGRGKMRLLDNAQPGDSMFLCQSDDRRMGLVNDAKTLFTTAQAKKLNIDLSAEGPLYLACNDCPLQGDEKNWVSKGCRYTYTLRCFDLEANRPFAYFVKGSQMSPIRAMLVDRVTPRSGPNGTVIAPDRPFWFAEVEFTTKNVTEGSRSWYVPVVKIARELTAEEMAPYAAISSMVRTAEVEAPEDEDEGQAGLPEEA